MFVYMRARTRPRTPTTVYLASCGRVPQVVIVVDWLVGMWILSWVIFVGFLLCICGFLWCRLFSLLFCILLCGFFVWVFFFFCLVVCCLFVGLFLFFVYFVVIVFCWVFCLFVWVFFCFVSLMGFLVWAALVFSAFY